jgi:hypothetical protein
VAIPAKTKDDEHHAREIAMILLDLLDQRGIVLDQATIEAIVVALTGYMAGWPRAKDDA